MKTTIYLATARGLSVITSSNGSWRGAVRLKDKQTQCVAADLNRQEVVYCGTFGNGVFRSDDEGASWKQCNGVERLKVTSLATASSGAVYAGTEPSAIFRSDDGGETWHELASLVTLPSAKEWSFPPRPKTHHVRYILPDLVALRRLHVAVEAGALLRSDDAGETWRDRVSGAPKDTHSLAVHPSVPARLHSAAGDGYFESVNDGDNWRRIVDGLEHQYCWSIAVSLANPMTLLLSASKSAREAHLKESANSFVYHRTGNGAWREVRDGLPDPRGWRIPVVAASTVAPRGFYLSSEGEVYRSADGGLRWEHLTVQWDDNTRSEHAVDMAITERD